MVKKLFKHEFLAYIRVMGVVYLVLLGVAALSRFVQFFEAETVPYNIVRGASFAMYGICALGTLAANTVMAVVRFYRNLFTGEGYLTLTLPVTPAQHIWVKVLTALCMEAVTWLVVMASGCVITAGEVLVEVIKAAAYIGDQIYGVIGFHGAVFGAELVIVMAGQFAAAMMLYYLCIAIGQLFRKNRILAAVGAYVGFYILSQILATVYMATFSVYAMTGAFERDMEQLWRFVDAHPYTAMHSFLWIGFAVQAVFFLVEFLAVKGIITKKLNLE